MKNFPAVKSNYKLLICFLLGVGFSVNALAGLGAANRQIIKIGCHNLDHTCYIFINGNPVGPEGCESNSIRWSKEVSPNGEAMLALFMMAFAAEKKVSITTSEQCYSGGGPYPTIQYINVH